MTILPKVPSRLLRIAHTDLEKIRHDPAYLINMGVWAYRTFDSEPIQCEACLAGAVMIKTLRSDLPTRSTYYPSDFPDNDNQLEAINLFRCNDPNRAFQILNLPMPSPPNAPNIPSYKSESDDFMTALLALADHFEVHGF